MPNVYSELHVHIVFVETRALVSLYEICKFVSVHSSLLKYSELNVCYGPVECEVWAHVNLG